MSGTRATTGTSRATGPISTPSRVGTTTTGRNTITTATGIATTIATSTDRGFESMSLAAPEKSGAAFFGADISVWSYPVFMKSRAFPKALFLALALVSSAAFAADSPWQETDRIFGQTGKAQPGDVVKYSWPR